MAIVAVVIICVYSARMPRDRKLLQLALAITMGGILGNFVDRILHGYVIDFIDFHIHEVFQWPTFNIADSAITIGIALLLIDTVKNPAPEEIQRQPTINSRS
jgi:signal peptidase II